MEIARTSPIERIAGVLAAHALSRNGEGDMDSAAEAVDRSGPIMPRPRSPFSRR